MSVLTPAFILTKPDESFSLPILISVPITAFLIFVPWSVTSIGKPSVRYFHIALNAMYTGLLTLAVLNGLAGTTGPWVYFILWTVYWVISKRVRNRYAKKLT
jgi:hypothetical protein